VSIKDCTSRVPNKTTTLFLVSAIIKAIFTQSAHKRNGDNQAQEPGREGRKKGFVRDLAHTK